MIINKQTTDPTLRTFRKSAWVTGRQSNNNYKASSRFFPKDFYGKYDSFNEKLDPRRFSFKKCFSCPLLSMEDYGGTQENYCANCAACFAFHSDKCDS